METLPKFNIFKVLNKDNKELIHSAFLKFLLEEDNSLIEELLGIKLDKSEEKIKINLEHKIGNQRFDIFIKNGNNIIVIENKFKSLPYLKQLEEYSTVLDKKFSGKTINKYLLYFAKGNDFNLPNDWKVITYNDLVKLISDFLEKNDLAIEKIIFIEHYLSILRSYIEQYEKIKKSEGLSEIFKNPKDKDNGFWLKLVFFELAAMFPFPKYTTFVSKGNSYKPFINIHIPKWNHIKGDKDNKTGHEFVIQLNGTNLKYYAHLWYHSDREEFINKKVKILKDNKFKTTTSGHYKNKPNPKHKTGYIYQENIINVLEDNNKKITLHNIKGAIDDLINKINDSINL